MSLKNKVQSISTGQMEVSHQIPSSGRNTKNLNSKTFRCLCIHNPNQQKDTQTDKQNYNYSNDRVNRLKSNESLGQKEERELDSKKIATNMSFSSLRQDGSDNPYNCCLHSNKGGEIPQLLEGKSSKSIKEILKAKADEIITSGETKDGQYCFISRALSGDELTEAVESELKANLKNKKHTQTKAASPRNSLQIDQSRVSSKENGNIKAYAVNTHQGITRNYNEDRVSIILNISKDGVKSSFFAIYDGHGGSNCCEYLSEHLHQHILNSRHFPSHPRKAIIQGIKLAEHNFIELVKRNVSNGKQLDRSGSCITLALFVANDCYVANLGDSRAVLSTCRGKPLYSLSRDHKPSDLNEQQRILKSGGKIYRTEMIKKTCSDDQRQKSISSPIIGPLRVFPGKLSITRTIGDIEAKDRLFGGLENCISSDPEICKYTLTGKEDFIVLGCDGIFEKMESEDVVKCVWRQLNKKQSDLHEACGKATESIIRESMLRKSTDNVTAILICLGQVCRTLPTRLRSI